MGLIEWKKYNGWTIGFTIIDFLPFVLSICVTISLIRRLYDKNDKNARDMESIIKHGTLACALLFALSCIFIFGYTVNSQWAFPYHLLLNVAYVSCWALGKILFYSLFIYGLYQSFHNAPYLRYPKYVFIILWSVIAFNIIGVIVVCFLLAFGLIEVFVYIAFLAFIYDILFSLVLWILFQTKLQIVVVNRIASSQSNVFDERDMMLVSTMSKYTFLTFVTTFAAIPQLILQIFRSTKNSYFSDPFVIYLSNVLLIWNGLIHCYVLFLKYNFSEKHYKKYCNAPRILFEGMCVKNTNMKALERSKSKKDFELSNKISNMSNGNELKLEMGINSNTNIDDNFDLTTQTQLQTRTSGTNTSTQTQTRSKTNTKTQTKTHSSLLSNTNITYTQTKTQTPSTGSSAGCTADFDNNSPINIKYMKPNNKNKLSLHFPNTSGTVPTLSIVTATGSDSGNSNVPMHPIPTNSLKHLQEIDNIQDSEDEEDDDDQIEDNIKIQSFEHQDTSPTG